MANQWVVVLSSDAYGNEFYKYDSPKEQVEGVTRLLESAQKHHAVDGVRRAVIAIPDPYRGKQDLEDFVASYIS